MTAEIAEINKALNLSVAEEVEKRAKAWLETAMGTDWVAKFEDLFAANERLKKQVADSRFYALRLQEKLDESEERERRLVGFIHAIKKRLYPLTERRPSSEEIAEIAHVMAHALAAGRKTPTPPTPEARA